MSVAALKAYEDAAQPDAEVAFDAPRPLPPKLPSAPSLPGDMVPRGLRPWITDISERMQAPLEMVATPVIVAVASLIARKTAIHPKAKDDWLVVPNLWGGLVASPGKLKSPILAKTLAPIQDLEKAAHREHRNQVAQNEARLGVLEARAAGIKDQLKRAFRNDAVGPPPDGLDQKLVTVREEIRQLKIQGGARRYVVNDPTIEKLGEILQTSQLGILLVRDELAGWVQSLDRRDRPGDRQFFLEAWNGNSSYTFDRIGRGTVHIPALCI
ncbi:MAG: DUF3987 domain-containing protein, partial [Acidobacteriota bacterium]